MTTIERTCPRCKQRFTAEISILSGPLGNFRWAQVACDQCHAELRKEKEKKTDKKGLHG
jgi:hypothetical protein